jgi:hypothetical protein
MKEIARLHAIHKAVVLDRDPKFTSNFWNKFELKYNILSTNKWAE